MSIYTYTNAYTRAEAVVDQIDVLFTQACIAETSRTKICTGVRERWLEAVGLYLARDNQLVYEIEAKINWSAYSDSAELSFSSDLPGWEGNGSPEAIILGSRFDKQATGNKLDRHYWGRFVKSIRDDLARHQQLCPQVGLQYGGKVPDWKSTPTDRSFHLQDLGEIGVSERSAL